MKQFSIFAGTSNPSLGRKISRKLRVDLGEIELQEFPNREIRVRVLNDVNLKIAFILQSTSYPAERNIVELAFIADSIRRMGAKKIVALVPWFGYAPQDKVFREGEPLSSEVIVKMLESTEVDEFAVVDIHSSLVLNLFTKPLYHVSAMSVFIDYFKHKLKKGNWCSVALDKGAVKRATKFAKVLDLPLVKFTKERDKGNGEVTFHCLNGDVNGMNLITFDDYISTGGTLIKSCDYLKKEGAKKCCYCVSHLIVPETIKKINESSIDHLYISDSIDYGKEYPLGDKIKRVTLVPLLVDLIKTILRLEMMKEPIQSLMY